MPALAASRFCRCVVAFRSGWGVRCFNLNSTSACPPRAGFQPVCASASLMAVLWLALTGPARAETLPEALVRPYQNNPQRNAERARQRGTDEGVSQALAGYRPQLLLTLTGGLQQVRVLFFDNTIQTQTLRTWTIGFTVSQTLFNGFKTANTVRQSEAQRQSGREALRNTGQGVLLDAVTAEESHPPFSRRCTTSMSPNSAPRSPRAACCRPSRCREISSANGRTILRSAPRATISPRCWERRACRFTTAGWRPRRSGRPRRLRCRLASCRSSSAIRPRPRF